MADDLQNIIQTIQGMATKAAEPEAREPGPGDVGPSSEVKPEKSQLVTLKMTEEEVGDWFARIELAIERRKKREEQWDLLLNEYLPIVTKSGAAETVKVPRHFRDVHSKIGSLFYRSPDLTLTPKDPSPAQNMMQNPMAMMMPGQPPAPPLQMEDIIAIKQAVLKEKLGRDGIKGERLMDELLFDTLAWSGFGCAKIGYRCVFKMVEKPVLGPPALNPMQMGGSPQLGPPQPPTGPPPPLAPPMPPAMQMVEGQPAMAPQPATAPQPVPIYEEFYWRRFSPKKLLYNHDLRSTRFDEDATFMGMEFFMSVKKAMRPPDQGGFGLSEDEASKSTSDDRIHEYEEDPKSVKSDLVHGYELWLKASLFTDESHPQAINQLVLIEGIKDRPIVWRPSADQDFDAEGKLTPDSLVGFPIRVLTIRDLADSPFTPSDAAFTNSEIKQLSTWRRQSIQIRDASIGKYLYDKGAFVDTAELDQLKNGEIGEFIGVEDGRLAAGADKVFTTTAQVHQTRDDYQGEIAIRRDLDDTLGISSVQGGNVESTIHSATEIATVEKGSQARNDKELSRVVDYYLDGARMLDQLLMRYATSDDYVQITGDAGAQVMQLWNGKMISGRYLYEIAPDSQLRVDTARDFQLTLNLYNLTAQDPLVNRPYILRRLARMRGLDPNKIVLPPMAQTLPPHGGPGQAVNQHVASNSGARPNQPGQPNQRQQQQPTAQPPAQQEPKV